LIDLVLILLAFGVKRNLGDENTPSRGVANVFEMIVEGLYNLVESTAGSKWAKQFFPWVATIILLVLGSNLLKLFPGFESIGIVHEAHEGGYPIQQVIPGIVNLLAVEEGAEPAGEHLYELVPFFRSPSTDLNFTVALALTTIVVVQIFGVKANGLGYFTKFFNFGPFLKIWYTKKLGVFDVIMPFIDIIVGLLELIAEMAKIVSFSFRLFGALFGGAILVAVLGTLVPAVQFGLLFLELFIGSIQALVFGMLALVFMTVATQSHGHGGEEGEAH
ncbi:MAG TPA: F0F1 ATP synthase subunit A, partial [Anaerolineales bacterium]|nr:F0F1 ATP synthase subunit A [Anaerolineales bacterium]